MQNSSPIKAILSISSYPLFIAGGLGLYALLVAANVDLQLATYIPVVLSGALLIALEWYLPYRSSWMPDKDDLVNDSVYMALIQAVLPEILTFFIALNLLDFLNANNLTLKGFWPHEIPVWLQVVLMLLVADFFRYWLHRFAHEWKSLWKFHAVHHSPQKLYWFNVGRFHPVDKGLQYLLDALPFILLGVSDEVLALYLVFYAINGFFQHSNVDVKLGPLNWVISGPELHRWHHSKIIDESNSNYGNNLIIWDAVFGTRFFPDDKEVDDLGLLNRSYPMDFIRQFKAPFVPGLDKANSEEE